MALSIRSARSECTVVYLPNEEANTVNVEIGDEGEIYVEEKPHINETVSPE